jgi:hypothetical protein
VDENTLPGDEPLVDGTVVSFVDQAAYVYLLLRLEVVLSLGYLLRSELKHLLPHVGVTSLVAGEYTGDRRLSEYEVARDYPYLLHESNVLGISVDASLKGIALGFLEHVQSRWLSCGGRLVR